MCGMFTASCAATTSDSHDLGVLHSLIRKLPDSQALQVGEGAEVIRQGACEEVAFQSPEGKEGRSMRGRRGGA